jgi:hypothetical protein
MKSRSGTPHLVYKAAPGRTCAAAQPCPAPAALQLHPVHQQRRGGLGGFAKSGADSGDGSIRTRAWGSQSPRLVHAYALVMAPSGSRGGEALGLCVVSFKRGSGTPHMVCQTAPRRTLAARQHPGPPARWPAVQDHQRGGQGVPEGRCASRSRGDCQPGGSRGVGGSIETFRVHQPSTFLQKAWIWRHRHSPRSLQIRH